MASIHYFLFCFCSHKILITYTTFSWVLNISCFDPSFICFIFSCILLQIMVYEKGKNKTLILVYEWGRQRLIVDLNFDEGNENLYLYLSLITVLSSLSFPPSLSFHLSHICLSSLSFLFSVICAVISDGH